MKGFTLATLITTVLLIPLQSTASPDKNGLVPECQQAECIKYFQQYRMYTRRGYSDAMYTLAELYYRGYGTEKNLSSALKWYRKAAKFENADAQYKAGILYLREGEYQDIERGLKYLRTADRNGVAEASHLLGLVYFEGQLTEQDLKLADEYFSHALKSGHQDTINFFNQLDTEQSSKKQQLKLAATLAKDPTNQASDTGAKPVGEMETITITGPDLSEIFDYQLARLDLMSPDAVKGTGTNIPGRTCDEMIACGHVDQDRYREFFMTGW